MAGGFAMSPPRLSTEAIILPVSRSIHTALPELPSKTRCGVDPVSWTLHPLGEEESRCRNGGRIRTSLDHSWWS